MLHRMRRIGPIAITTAAVLLSGLILTSCGGDSDSNEPSAEDRDQIMSTFNRLQKAFVDDDVERLCNQLTFDAQERAGDAAHGVGSPCDQNMERFFELIRSGGGFKPSNPQPEMVSLEGQAPRVTMTVKLPGKPATELPFLEEDGVWKLDSLFGISATEAKRYASSIARSSFPSGGGAAVEVSNKQGDPCPPLDESALKADPRAIAGGCRYRILSEGYLPVNVSTVFGDFTLADCTIYLDTQVDASGRTWTLETGLGAKTGGTSACGDVYGCTSDPAGDERSPGAEWPMRGRISDDGGDVVQRIGICFETCVGFFAGELDLRFQRQGDRLRTEAVDSRVGRSGMAIDGAWEIEPGGTGLEIARAGA